MPHSVAHIGGGDGDGGGGGCVGGEGGDSGGGDGGAFVRIVSTLTSAVMPSKPDSTRASVSVVPEVRSATFASMTAPMASKTALVSPLSTAAPLSPLSATSTAATMLTSTDTFTVGAGAAVTDAWLPSIAKLAFRSVFSADSSSSFCFRVSKAASSALVSSTSSPPTGTATV